AETVKAKRVQVLLPEHVVDVHTGAGHDHPRPRSVRAGDARAPALAVDGRDVRGLSERVAGLTPRGPGRARSLPEALDGRVEPARLEEAPGEPFLVEPVHELVGALGLRLLHRSHDLVETRHAEPLQELEAEGD